MIDPIVNHQTLIVDGAVHITEVGPRDGLQNEAIPISTDVKVAFIDLLSASGVVEIEVSSFVSPKWIPQLGDAAEVFRRIQRQPGVVYSALVPNEKGLEAALELGKHAPDKIAIFTAASETFSRKNTNASIAETLERFKPVIARAQETQRHEGTEARRHGVPTESSLVPSSLRASVPSTLPVRAYISCAVACPYEGPTDPKKVRDLAAKLLDLGVDEIDIADTIGVAVPTDIDMIYEALDGMLTPEQTTLHLHDTRGTALACVYRAMQLGVRSFDSSCGGIGGCPYAPGAPGNLATEALVLMLERAGVKTGVDRSRLIEASRHISTALHRPAPSGT